MTTLRNIKVSFALHLNGLAICAGLIGTGVQQVITSESFLETSRGVGGIVLFTIFLVPIVASTWSIVFPPPKEYGSRTKVRH